MRLHIIGGAGSGKSYIAEQLSKKFNIPHYDLDHIFWDKNADEYGIKAPPTVRDNNLKEIVEQPAWIIEGVYFKWLDPSFALADHIFILNTPVAIQEERIWSRYKKRKAGVLPSTKNETIQSVKKLIDWNKKYNHDFLPNFVRNNDYKGKMIQLENNENIFNYLM
ncbi:hypothetical protein ACW2QC_19815 [Virgibacillus sp. FSP13]